MIINLDESPHKLPDYDTATEIVNHMEWDERTGLLFCEEPTDVIVLVQAVHNHLYNPSDFTHDQLIGAYNMILDGFTAATEKDDA